MLKPQSLFFVSPGDDGIYPHPAPSLYGGGFPVDPGEVPGDSKNGSKIEFIFQTEVICNILRVAAGPKGGLGVPARADPPPTSSTFKKCLDPLVQPNPTRGDPTLKKADWCGACNAGAPRSNNRKREKLTDLSKMWEREKQNFI